MNPTPNLPPASNLAKEEVLLEWTSPARPFKERTREFYTTVLSIAFLLGVILLLLKEFLLIGVIIAFAFLSYVLSTHKPEDVTHQLTSNGVRTDNKLYPWVGLISFWLKKEYDQEVVYISTQAKIPGALILVIDQKKRPEIVKTLGDKLPLVEASNTFVDRASDWLGKKIPLENT